MNEELVKILKMIENKIITAEEGQKLIQAMETAKKKVATVNQTMSGRFLHIDVESLEKGDEEVVEINIPLNVAKSFLKLGFVQNQINEKVGTDVAVDIDEITRLIDLDFVGDLVMVDTKDAKVRIWID
ncbi:hypothetical protein [Turicibacter sanguinis]|uniref:hypothetical protein n=1 Tax=Turicibacter sanguinis TaxID=154288 RepID=UPI00399A4DAE